MTNWVTSDSHFRHANIIKYTNRPFDSVEEMDTEMVRAWNSVVEKGDIVYHLGDFTLNGKDYASKIFARLNGNIRILGYQWHHDKRWINKMDYISRDGSRVIILPPMVLIKTKEIDCLPITLCHYPLSSWDRSYHGSYHLFGHCHNVYKPHNKSLDIGVDSVYNIFGEYRPLSIPDAVMHIRGYGHNYEEDTLDGR